jgi:hypothetical protein
MKTKEEAWIAAIILIFTAMLMTGPKITGLAVSENSYDTLIQKAAAEHDTSFALVKAIIKQESNFNTNAVSDTGCIGLMQFCYDTAEKYSEIFKKLTICNCQGSICKIEEKRACSPGNDDRFDPEKSTDAGAKLIKSNEAIFDKYSAKYEFALAAYNGGPCIIQKAIKATGKNDPSWQEASNAITPDIVKECYTDKDGKISKYFDEASEREGKVKQIIDYVKIVMENYAIYGGQSADAGDSSGVYTVRPSFEASVNYDFSDYDKIKQGLEKLREICVKGGANNIEQCIKDSIAAVSSQTKLSWSIGSCDKGEKALFYSFIEAYNECFFSLDNDCYCKAEIHKDETLNGDYKIHLADSGVYTATIGAYSQELEGHRYYSDISGEVFTDSRAQLDIELKFDKGQIKEQKFQSLFIAEKDNFVLYKNASLVAVATKIQDTQNMPAKPLCKTAKQHFQFCVKNDARKYPKIDENGKLTSEPVVYKFAAIFKDTVPPPKITTLTVKDKAGAEKGLTLEWNKSEAKDTNRYEIYLLEKRFTNIEEAENVAEIKSDNQTIQANISVQQDDKIYYIIVTAVDNSNNELLDVIPMQGISIDDLGPEKPIVGDYDKTSKKIAITIPTKNTDSTEITEQEISVYIRKIPISIPAELDCTNPDYIDVKEELLLKGKPGEQKQISIELERGCYIFTAKDSKGNEKITKQDKRISDLVTIRMVT